MPYHDVHEQTTFANSPHGWADRLQHPNEKMRCKPQDIPPDMIGRAQFICSQSTYEERHPFRFPGERKKSKQPPLMKVSKRVT